MRSADARLRKMEKRVRGRDERYRRSSEDLGRMLAGAMLAHIPGYALIAEADADPETWRDLQRVRAEAEGRWEDAKRFKASPGPADTDPAYREHTRRLRFLRFRAIANARRRIARETGKPLREVLPKWRRAFR